MIIVLLYRHAVKPPERSVHRFTNLFHSSVKLLRLVSINVVRGTVYHLSREQIVEMRMSKINTGLCYTKLLQNKYNLCEL